MKTNSKYCRKIPLLYMEMIAAACFLFLFIIPVIRGVNQDNKGYYVVYVNDQEVGVVSKEDIAEEAFVNARIRMAKEAQDLVFVDAEYSVKEEKKLFGQTQTKETIEEKIYEALNNNILETKQRAYTVKIDEFSVTLASKEEVVQLLESSKNKYDANNEFSIELVADAANPLNILTTNFVKPEITTKNVDTVTSAESEEEALQEATVQESEPAIAMGIESIEFDEQVQIIETYITPDKLTPVSDAIDMVTKDKETNKIYEVIEGDCLSIVAQKNETSMAAIIDMNELLTEESVIQIGDEIVVTVPEPELSVMVKETASYEEDYEEEVQYVENDSWYTTQEVIRQDPSTGYRSVVASITYRNGKETDREILEATIIVEAVSKIVEKGTLTPPTYVKPISVGVFTSGFGVRWGRMHKGVDWACPIGTAVKASSGGVVVSAGWASGYGNCITISHPDGKMTRYAHLSKILVSNGTRVSQGDKIALSGNTGRSTGPHLHFEIFVGGSQVNPLKYLN